MARMLRLASLVLFAVAACDRAEVRVSPAAVSAFEGERTVVRVEAELGCDDPGDPVLELPDGLPAAAFLAEVRADRSGEGEYFIGNPGRDRDVVSPGDPGGEPIPADPATGRTVSICTGGGGSLDDGARGYDVLIEPAPLAAPGAHRLRVRVEGCGTEAAAELTVDVRGAVDLGPFCGITTGAACADDAGCERAGCGELCAAAGTREAEALRAALPWASCGSQGRRCLASGCTDPVPTGAICGCVQGACSWRPP